MPPVLKASAGLHAAAALSVGLQPAAWPWAAGAVALNHLGVTALGLWPTSRLLGPNLLRLPDAAVARREITLTFDDGPEPAVTPQVLDLLDQFGAKATFFCIGERVLAHRELAQEIVRRGHRIDNHSHVHRHNFSLLGPTAVKREVLRAQDAIAEVTGRVPRFFRAPAGLRNIFLDPVLHQLDLRLASWTRRGFDTARSNPDYVYGRLTDGLAAGDLLLLHDGHAAHTAAGQPIVLQVLPRLLQACSDQSLKAVTLDQACSPSFEGAAMHKTHFATTMAD
jgi:peptidoglycan/xylan/chitin deacetylase (PgdA/CDA1 family)